MPKLTKRLIDAMPLNDQPAYVWDDQLKGFGVRASANGTMSYLVRYRVGTGRRARQRKLTIGRHGSPWTVETARREALRILSSAAHGEDILDVRQSQNAELRFSELAKKYIAEHAIPNKKPSSVREDQRLFRTTLLPRFGSLRVAEICERDILKLHSDLAATKSKANHCLSLLSKMFNLAETWGYRERRTNPCWGIRKYKVEPRERFLSKEEIGRLFSVLTEAETDGAHPHAIAILRLLILTGARKGEIISLEWREVDLERRTIAKKDTKTGRRAVPISKPVVDILSGLERQEGSSFVFPAARGDSHFQGLTKEWLQIRKRAGLEDVRIHDLRHTFASISIMNGVPIAVLSKLLGHASITTTERYAHLSNDPVRQGAEEVGSVFSGWLAN
ncbi:tyrosine-type recombinase/integrase [Hyphobacterium sp.]|uniref:tyrosine-type recombinase/integrase n=1 Tax=Hyphobacterium sp. TaxID=2004662 RepID=UPI003B524F8C